MLQHLFLQQHRKALPKIARGSNMWKAKRNGPVKKFCAFYKEAALALASNMQLVELGVKDADLCGATGLGEMARTAMAIVCSAIVAPATLLRQNPKSLHPQLCSKVLLENAESGNVFCSDRQGHSPFVICRWSHFVSFSSMMDSTATMGT